MRLPLLDIISVWGIREPFSALSHAFGALLALWATLHLVHRARKRGRKGGSVLLYGATVVLAFSASALFHSVEASPDRLALYGTIDHAAIFFLIAGTGTAIYSSLDVHWADQLIAAVWGLTILAIAMVLLFESLGGWKIAVLYLALGWVASMGLFVRAGPGTWEYLRSFLAGGLVFSVGALVFATHWPNVWPGVIEAHEVFHVLVLIGEAFHLHFVYQYCTCPSAFCKSDSEAVSAPIRRRTEAA